MVNTRNLQIITRQGTKSGDDQVKRNSTVLQNYEHPKTKMQGQTFNHATQVCKDLAIQEDKLDHKVLKSMKFCN